MTHERDLKSLRAVNLGLGTNVLLAEGINSTSDVAYYIAASIFVRMASKPADSDHPYGHRQFESIGSLLIGAFVIATAVDGDHPQPRLAQRIADLIGTIDGVAQLEELQAHRFGPHIVVNLTIGIDGALSVTEGDRIASRVEEMTVKAVPNVRRVHVHYHPAEAGHAARTIDEILKSPHYPE